MHCNQISKMNKLFVTILNSGCFMNFQLNTYFRGFNKATSELYRNRNKGQSLDFVYLWLKSNSQTDLYEIWKMYTQLFQTTFYLGALRAKLRAEITSIKMHLFCPTRQVSLFFVSYTKFVGTSYLLKSEVYFESSLWV